MSRIELTHQTLEKPRDPEKSTGLGVRKLGSVHPSSTSLALRLGQVILLPIPFSSSLSLGLRIAC